ncbi:enabled -like protein, partial [Brachionus plicatilis]
MSQTNSEQSIVSAKANVMVYDDMGKKWNPSGAAPGLSKVQIYQHLLNQTYRVVGRKIQDHEVVINCSLQKNLKYNQANQTFLQWRDSKQVYGLHFQCKDEADVFTQTLKMAVDNLNRLAISSSSSASSTSSSNAGAGGDNISIGKRSVASAGSS